MSMEVRFLTRAPRVLFLATTSSQNKRTLEREIDSGTQGITDMADIAYMADLTIMQFNLYGIPVFFLYPNGYGGYSGYGRFDNKLIQYLWDPCVIHQVLSLH